MPRTVTLFDYSELSAEAQERARADRRAKLEQSPDCPWQTEICASLSAALRALDCRASWSIGVGQHSCAVLETPNLGEGETPLSFVRARLAGLGYPVDSDGAVRFPGICPLTGYCEDDGVLEAFYRAVVASTDDSFALHAGVRAAVRQASMSIDAEWDYYLSDENLGELCSDDGEEYLADGKRVD